MTFSDWDIMRAIAVTIASIILLYIFKKQIKTTITSLILNKNPDQTEKESIDEILSRIESNLDEVLK